MDGVVLFAAGMIGGGVALLGAALFAAARRSGPVGARGRKGAGRSRIDARVRPETTRVGSDPARRSASANRLRPGRRGGGALPDRHDVHRQIQRPRPDRRDGADQNVDRVRRPGLNRASALLADTVLLQPVPAWSIPVRPRNDGPRALLPPPRWNQATVPNAGPRHNDERQEPIENISRRYETRGPDRRGFTDR
jgi:hypothetical protein